MAQRSVSGQAEEGGSYLASVSDLMSGLIFLFIIALMVFAFTYQSQEEYLTNTEEIRANLLLDLEKTLKQQGITVEVDLQQGILRLPEEILFPSGQARLTTQGQRAISVLAKELAVLLPCYTGPWRPSSERPDTCSEEHWHPGRLDTILIEGHTDDQPIVRSSRFQDNWYLSSARAIETYKQLVATPEGDLLQNTKNRMGEPVFGVSGYAFTRAVAPNDDPATRALNRRIDLRFLMAPPTIGRKTEKVLRTLTSEEAPR